MAASHHQRHAVNDDVVHHFPGRHSEVGWEGDHTLMWTDPTVASILVHQANLVSPWEIQAAGFGDPELLLDAAGWIVRQVLPVDRSDYTQLELLRSTILRLHPGKGSDDQLIIALRLREVLEHLALTPVATDAFSAAHLRAAGPTLMGGGSLASPDAESAIRYFVPSLSEVSVDDLARLRASDAVYATVREALTRATREAELGSLKALDFMTYEQRVRAVADEFITPACELLVKDAKRTKFKRLAAEGTAGGLASLAVSGIAHLLAAPKLPGVTRAAGRLAEQ